MNNRYVNSFVLLSLICFIVLITFIIHIPFCVSDPSCAWMLVLWSSSQRSTPQRPVSSVEIYFLNGMFSFNSALRIPGSCAFLTRLDFLLIPDLGCRIPNPFFWELRDKFLCILLPYTVPEILCQFAKKIFFPTCKKNQFCEICAYKEFFLLLLLLFLDLGSETKIIPDPHHCLLFYS